MPSGVILPGPALRLTRLVFSPSACAFFFTPHSTPAPFYRSGPVLPPAVCWSDPAHLAPEPTCRCGYHWFTTRAAALEYLKLLSPHPARTEMTSRFLATFEPSGVLPATQPFTMARSSGGTYLTVHLAGGCRCGRRSTGVVSYTPGENCTETLDHRLGYSPLAQACPRHLDSDLTHLLGSFLPLAPL